MSECKNCGAQVKWKKVGGKWQCHNAGTETDHWDLCSQRKFAFIKETGDYFETKREKGYWTDLKSSGVQYVEQSSGVKKSKHRPSGDCANCVLPWEVCSWPCPDALP